MTDDIITLGVDLCPLCKTEIFVCEPTPENGIIEAGNRIVICAKCVSCLEFVFDRKKLRVLSNLEYNRLTPESKHNLQEMRQHLFELKNKK